MSDLVHVEPQSVLTPSIEIWNQPYFLMNTQCFTYAIDAPTLGSIWFYHVQGIDMADDKEARPTELVKDLDNHPGFERIHQHGAAPQNSHIIALDYMGQHVFRFNAASGVWSDKRGMTPVRHWDDNGDPMLDLEAAKIQLGGPLAYYRLSDVGLMVAPSTYVSPLPTMDDPPSYVSSKELFLEKGGVLEL